MSHKKQPQILTFKAALQGEISTKNHFIALKKDFV